ncbi:3-dehydroquinate synthase [Halobacillus fulvus]|nr:3-dehydroquinate synthase [Halobacillus fulvus]
MTTLMIQASTHDYEVVIEAGLRHQLKSYIPSGYPSILIITDDQVASYYLKDIEKGLEGQTEVHSITVPEGEASKSMAQYERLLDMCVECQLDRKSLIIALGGGMVGDLAGFVASTYLRGIDFIQMPTTILAHDSSVGGKVAINHPKGKNLIGSFYNPVKVLYDTETLQSLPFHEIRSGYGEVVKHALLSDQKWYEQVCNRDLTDISSHELEEDLKKGIQVKAQIVEEDERETGVRKYLNLGHTLTHAIEAELGYGKITHGEAVAVGIWFALQLSEKTNNVSLPVESYVNWMRQNQYPLDQIRKLKAESLMARMKLDKKTIHKHIHYVLLKEIGEPEVNPVADEFLLEELKRFLSEVE